MRGLRRLFTVVSVLVVFVFGLGLCGSVWDVKEMSIFTWLTVDESIILITGVVMVAITLLTAIMAFVEFVLPENTYAFQAGGGEVRVAFTAIEDYVRRLSGQVPGLKEMRPSVRSSKRGLELVIRVVLEAHANIPEASARVQEVIRRRVEQELGIQDVGPIRVYVSRIAHDERKPVEQGEG